ncbi:MAG: hypothetical protein H7282_00325 [Cytophagaceae bacterium]|nr:hypothetical protein [Cytophagaceae bacterium]
MRKEYIQYDITKVTTKNAETPLEQLEAINALFYNEQKIQEFVNRYSFQDKNDIGILFIAESLSKSSLKHSNDAIYESFINYHICLLHVAAGNK